MKLIDLLADTDVRCKAEMENIEVKGIAFNSEEVVKGDIFLCIKGNSGNEKFYSMDAAFKGAKVIITDADLDIESMPILKTENCKETLSIISHNFYKVNSAAPSKQTSEKDSKSENKAELTFGESKTEPNSVDIGNKAELSNINVVGITGTNGKTTVAYMLKNIFEVSNKSCGIIGTINYSFRDKVYQAINTTPDFCYLEKLLFEMRSAEVNNCIMEVSSQGLELGRVDDIQFNYSIFTNLSQDHLDFHTDMESYFAAKTKLFLMSKHANFINVDDAYGEKLVALLKRKTDLKTVTYSILDEKADYYCKVNEEKLEGSNISVFERGNHLGDLWVNMPGTYMVSNAMAAVACARVDQTEFEKIKKGIETMGAIPGRFELVENSKGINIVVDFAHTPIALKNLLQTVCNYKKGRVICVFGCGGERDRDKRGKMGKVAGTYADFVVITSDNPRTESQGQIGEDIESGLYETGCDYEMITDRSLAIKKGIEFASKGDFLIIAGKGHENYQIIGKEKHYFDDKETVMNMLKDK